MTISIAPTTDALLGNYKRTPVEFVDGDEIGRASCRERV